MIWVYTFLTILGCALIWRGIIDSLTAEHWDRGWFETIIGMLMLIIYGKELISLL